MTHGLGHCQHRAVTDVLMSCRRPYQAADGLVPFLEADLDCQVEPASLKIRL